MVRWTGRFRKTNQAIGIEDRNLKIRHVTIGENCEINAEAEFVRRVNDT
ncbi:hypothetical protein [Paraburkholderia lycopersici]|nr:hypothetical protein [Paraburkholderia lycopersici]